MDYRQPPYDRTYAHDYTTADGKYRIHALDRRQLDDLMNNFIQPYYRYIVSKPHSRLERLFGLFRQGDWSFAIIYVPAKDSGTTFEHTFEISNLDATRGVDVKIAFKLYLRRIKIYTIGSYIRL